MNIVKGGYKFTRVESSWYYRSKTKEGIEIELKGDDLVRLIVLLNKIHSIF